MEQVHCDKCRKAITDTCQAVVAWKLHEGTIVHRKCLDRRTYPWFFQLAHFEDEAWGKDELLGFQLYYDIDDAAAAILMCRLYVPGYEDRVQQGRFMFAELATGRK